MDLEAITDQVRAVVPAVQGLASDGRIDFAADATDEEKVAARAALAAIDPNAPAPMRYISKLAVVERLAEAKLLDAAFKALGPPGSLLYERWNAAVTVDTKHPDVRALLTAIGADLPTILAPTADA